MQKIKQIIRHRCFHEEKTLTFEKKRGTFVHSKSLRGIDVDLSNYQNNKSIRITLKNFLSKKTSPLNSISLQNAGILQSANRKSQTSTLMKLISRSTRLQKIVVQGLNENENGMSTFAMKLTKSLSFLKQFSFHFQGLLHFDDSISLFKKIINRTVRTQEISISQSYLKRWIKRLPNGSTELTSLPSSKILNFERIQKHENQFKSTFTERNELVNMNLESTIQYRRLAKEPKALTIQRTPGFNFTENYSDLYEQFVDALNSRGNEVLKNRLETLPDVPQEKSKQKSHQRSIPLNSSWGCMIFNEVDATIPQITF